MDAPRFAPPPIFVRAGEQLVQTGVYVFRCPVCAKLFRHDDRYEPMCTGPSESCDEHPPEVMRLVRVDPRRELIVVGG